MVSLAIAALVMRAAPSSLAHRQSQSYVLPLYDLVNHLHYDGMTSTVTSYLMSSAAMPYGWGSNMRVFYQPGGPAQISPNGNWIEVTYNGQWQVVGNELIFTWTSNTFVQGNVWVQYSGGPGDSINGAETSVVACEVNQVSSPGHGSRPGALVPIVDVVPGDRAQNSNNLNVSFNLYTPFGGMWGNSTPQYFQTTGPTTNPGPGGGWTVMANQNLGASNGSKQVSSLAHPTRPSGYYLVGVQETYTPSESYNTHNWTISEFSGVIRSYNVGG